MIRPQVNNGAFPIEKRIQPLVDLLNRVPYITTCSSCEGHFESKDYEDHRANVIFTLNKNGHEMKGCEVDLEHMINLILSNTAPHWSDALVQIEKQYYKLPDDKETELRTKYEISIRPFDKTASAYAKRRVTNEAIRRVEKGVLEYLSQAAIKN